MHSNEQTLLQQTLIYLATMVVAVPISKKLGLGAVLGYLIAGLCLGGTGLLDHTEGAEQLAEFGVIMMLFMIGLELKPALLWKLRGPIFGMGAMQVLGTTAVFAGIGTTLGFSSKESAAIGLILASSSTAIVLQSLQELGLSKRTGGEASFSILLFQDIAVIPILAALPFLSAIPNAVQGAVEVPAWLQFAKVIFAVVTVIAAGRFLVAPLFRAVARAKLRELFTAMALLLVLATTALMHAMGMSPALGAFLAGVALAENEYRHQLEVDIEPFKGLLLGVFFISVGAGIDFYQIALHPLMMITLILGIIGIKWFVLLGVGRISHMAKPDTLLLAFSLAQGGEFAFVLLNLAEKDHVMPPSIAQTLTTAVALSMAAAPLLMKFFVERIEPKFSAIARPQRETDIIDETDGQVIVAGMGRFGQTLSRMLRATGFKVTVLDYDSDQIDLVRKFGGKAFFGDASNLDLLQAAGAQHAKILAIAIDDYEATLKMAEAVRERFPHLHILARSYDRLHAYKLIHRGVKDIFIETSGSAILMGIEALKALGFSEERARRTADIFRRNNDRSVQELARKYFEDGEENYINQSRGYLKQMEKMLQEDLANSSTAQL